MLVFLLAAHSLLLASGLSPLDFDYAAFNFGAAHASDTPLIAAVKGGELEPVRQLLDSGVDVNARNAFGMTALHVAVYPHGTGGFPEATGDSVHREIVHELLDAGAELLIEDGFQLTPLMLADGKHLDNKVWTNYFGQKFYHNVWDLQARRRWASRCGCVALQAFMLTQSLPRVLPPPLLFLLAPLRRFPRTLQRFSRKPTAMMTSRLLSRGSSLCRSLFLRPRSITKRRIEKINKSK